MGTDENTNSQEWELLQNEHINMDMHYTHQNCLHYLDVGNHLSRHVKL